MTLKNSIIALFLTGGLTNFIYTAHANEGLFHPHQLNTPFNIKPVIKSVVQVKPLIKFRVHILKTKSDVQKFKNDPKKMQKEFLKEGGVIWQVAGTAEQFTKICKSPNDFLKPGMMEICDAYKDNHKNTNESFITDFLKGTGTGFIISNNGHILTNYHIARECIERLGRTKGSYISQPCKDVEISVAELIPGSLNPIYKKITTSIQILRNVSEEDWKYGFDFAVLKINHQQKDFLKPNFKNLVTETPTWTFGFPARTRRNSQQLKVNNYVDADGGLRVSKGRVKVSNEMASFLNTNDGVHGNSGSPVLDKNGKVLGIMRNMTDDADKNRVTKYTGHSINSKIRYAWEMLKLYSL